MAVYTKFSQENIESILSNYSIGNLDNYSGIQEGIENTNYALLVDKKKIYLNCLRKTSKRKRSSFFC